MKQEIKQKVQESFDAKYGKIKSYEQFKLDTNFEQLLMKKRKSNHKTFLNKKQFYLSSLATLILVVVACVSTSMLTEKHEDYNSINAKCVDIAINYIHDKCDNYYSKVIASYLIDDGYQLLLYGGIKDDKIIVFMQFNSEANLDAIISPIVTLQNNDCMQFEKIVTNYHIWTINSELLILDNAISVIIEVGNNRYEMTIFIDKNHVKNLLK